MALAEERLRCCLCLRALLEPGPPRQANLLGSVYSCFFVCGPLYEHGHLPGQHIVPLCCCSLMHVCPRAIRCQRRVRDPGWENTTSTDCGCTHPGPASWRPWSPPTPTRAVWQPTGRALRQKLLYTLIFTERRLDCNVVPYFTQPVIGSSPVAKISCPQRVRATTPSTVWQIVDLASPDLAPAGWRDEAAPEAGVFTDASVYELHIRDFSSSDGTVPERLRGKYQAFALVSSGTYQRSCSTSRLCSFQLLNS